MNGRKVVENLNDSLWFQINGTNPQSISLDVGFYTGTELATELQTQLNANADFTAKGVTFTVSYTPATGLYLITPSSGTIRYLDVNSAQMLSLRDSVAGHLFGLNADTSFGVTVTSDTAVFGLDTEASFISETASTVLEHYHDDIHSLTVDQAVHLVANTAGVSIDYTVVYEENV